MRSSESLCWQMPSFVLIWNHFFLFYLWLLGDDLHSVRPFLSIILFLVLVEKKQVQSYTCSNGHISWDKVAFISFRSSLALLWFLCRFQIFFHSSPTSHYRQMATPTLPFISSLWVISNEANYWILSVQYVQVTSMRFKATSPSEALMILPASSTRCALYIFHQEQHNYLTNCTFTCANISV